jgi:hypothetical protein
MSACTGHSSPGFLACSISIIMGLPQPGMLDRCGRVAGGRGGWSAGHVTLLAYSWLSGVGGGCAIQLCKEIITVLVGLPGVGVQSSFVSFIGLHPRGHSWSL